jgi:16S rRNA (uracil1498-N3)-methyltransferase
LFDGVAPESRVARVRSIGREFVELDIIGPGTSRHEPLVELTLAVAAPKAERFDWLVEKAVEVGVGTLQPLLTERSVVNPRVTKLERLRQRVIEASKQCGRNRLMVIAEPVTWRELLGQQPNALRLLAVRGAGGILPKPVPLTVVLAVGPEGGFTQEGERAADGAGWRPLGLGRAVLRVETAAVVGAAFVQTWALGELSS